MGYFRRKLDRRRARVALERHRDAPIADGVWRALADLAREPPGDFLRFAGPVIDRDSRQREGVFTVAYRLLGELDADAATPLREHILWFEAHLPVPPPVDARAIFFLKTAAAEATRRMWQLVDLLAAHGCEIVGERVVSPGCVVYEDEHQVAAIQRR